MRILFMCILVLSFTTALRAESDAEGIFLVFLGKSSEVNAKPHAFIYQQELLTIKDTSTEETLISGEVFVDPDRGIIRVDEQRLKRQNGTPFTYEEHVLSTKDSFYKRTKGDKKKLVGPRLDDRGNVLRTKTLSFRDPFALSIDGLDRTSLDSDRNTASNRFSRAFLADENEVDGKLKTLWIFPNRKGAATVYFKSATEPLPEKTVLAISMDGSAWKSKQDNEIVKGWSIHDVTTTKWSVVDGKPVPVQIDFEKSNPLTPGVKTLSVLRVADWRFEVKNEDLDVDAFCAADFEYSNRFNAIKVFFEENKTSR